MDADRFKRLETHFHAAVSLPAGERAAYIDDVCADDPTLRDRLLRLLGHVDDTLSFPMTPTIFSDVGDQTTAAVFAGPSETIGQRIGRYRLLDKLGEGGFGVVYRAEQEEDMRRQVALKIIKLGMDTRQVIARFEAERQALALMDHPGIAQVLDAGATDTGRPYFVMELVRGLPITEYCDRQRLNTQERLRLFVDVCHAVQHAHQKGIIHRDIKPTNVLVAVQDGKAVPKVIDFGIAKAITQRLTEKTYFTELRQLIGTPAYMSPEQAEMSPLDVDTRSDVYSLGVLLYELLTGTTPFDGGELHAAGYQDMQRIIREKHPPKPSARITTLGDKTDFIVNARRADPASLRRLLRRDLDWIVMRSLEKDRTRRYETADALGKDVQRHLDDEPVLAGPPRATYRLGKFVRRHRTLVGASVLLLAALVAGVLGTSWGWYRSTTAVAETTTVNAFMEDILTSVEPGRDGASVRLVEVLDDAAGTIDERFAKHPNLAADVRGILGQVYSRLDMPGKAETLLAPTVAYHESHYGPDDPRTLALRHQLAMVIMNQRRHDEAEPMLADVIERRRRTLGATHVDTIRSRMVAADLLARRGRYAESTDAYEQLLDEAERALGPAAPDTLAIKSGLARVYRFRGYMTAPSEESTQWFRRSLALSETLLERQRAMHGVDAIATLRTMADMAMLHRSLDDPVRQEALAREVIELGIPRFGESHWICLSAMGNLADALNRRDRLDEAADWAVRRAEAQRRKDGDQHVDTVTALSGTLHILDAAGRAQPGETYARIVYDRMRELLGSEHATVFNYRAYLARFITRQGRLDEAGEHFRALRDLEPGVDDGSIRLRFRAFHGAYLAALERFDEAESCLLRVANEGPPTDIWTAEPFGRVVYRELIALYEARGDDARADAWRERVVQEFPAQ